MNEAESIEKLETALQGRAEELAQEYISHAKQQRERILQEQEDRLRERERREEASAKKEAERRYQSQVESSRHAQQTRLEQHRWELIQDVMTEVNDRLASITEDSSCYSELMKALLAKAAAGLPATSLVAEMNARDRERLAETWDRLSEELPQDKEVRLANEAIPCTGGLLVRSADDQVRVDNTFEGRRERYTDTLHLLIHEALFEAVEQEG